MLLLTKYTVLYKENEICCIILLSLPSRERGLKYGERDTSTRQEKVAPFAGARIEILDSKKLRLHLRVAPFAGARIEIPTHTGSALSCIVAPFAGARIEIDTIAFAIDSDGSRSLRGSAD